MTNRPRYTVEPDGTGLWLLRDTQATPGTQILCPGLASRLAADTAAQALNRGLCETVDAQGRWWEGVIEAGDALNRAYESGDYGSKEDAP